MRNRLAFWLILIAKRLTTSGAAYDILCNAELDQHKWLQHNGGGR